MSANEQSPKRKRRVRSTEDARQRNKTLAHAAGSDCASVPLAHLITFTTYGTWLHGDERGSVDRSHNTYATPSLAADRRRLSYAQSARKGKLVTLTADRRDVVRGTIVEVCSHRGWTLQELNVRTKHVHAVVLAPCKPERVMNDFKSWATRRLRERALGDADRSPWTEHGSTRYLWKRDQLASACRYVLDGQGPDI